jgi:hypothetical protein
VFRVHFCVRLLINENLGYAGLTSRLCSTSLRCSSLRPGRVTRTCTSPASRIPDMHFACVEQPEHSHHRCRVTRTCTSPVSRIPDMHFACVKQPEHALRLCRIPDMHFACVEQPEHALRLCRIPDMDFACVEQPGHSHHLCRVTRTWTSSNLLTNQDVLTI